MYDFGEVLYQLPRDAAELARVEALIATHGKAAFSRDPFIGGHITGSAFVLSPDRRAVLMTHHAKLDRWLQLGGHCDGICDPRFVALKEAYEESGLSRIDLILEDILDVDIHAIPARKGEPEHLHYDLRYLMQVSDFDVKISHESKGLQWVSLNELERLTSSQSVLRMRDKVLKFIG